MNRKVIGILVVIVALLSIGVSAFFTQQKRANACENQTPVEIAVFVIGLNEYFVNDQVPGVKMDAVPFIQDGRVFVPVRFLGRALGVQDKDITWSQAERKASLTLGANSLSMVIGKKQIVLNGQVKAIDVAPVLQNKRTFLPARYVAEGLGYQVDWEPVKKIVICWPQDEPKPEISEVVKHVVDRKGKSEEEGGNETATTSTSTAKKGPDPYFYRCYKIDREYHEEGSPKGGYVEVQLRNKGGAGEVFVSALCEERQDLSASVFHMDTDEVVLVRAYFGALSYSYTFAWEARPAQPGDMSRGRLEVIRSTMKEFVPLSEIRRTYPDWRLDTKIRVRTNWGTKI